MDYEKLGNELTIATDSLSEMMLSVPPFTNIVINCGDDKEITMTFGEGKLEVSGDGDMNEAAKEFFNHYLVGIANSYIESQKGQ